MLVDTAIETVHLVITKHGALQAIFKDEGIAKEFATHFEDATVEPENLYSVLPRFYSWECRMSVPTGEVIETKECTPSFDRILMTVNNTEVLVVGTSKEEAEANAKEFRQRLLLVKTKEKDKDK